MQVHCHNSSFLWRMRKSIEFSHYYVIISFPFITIITITSILYPYVFTSLENIQFIRPNRCLQQSIANNNTEQIKPHVRPQ